MLTIIRADGGKTVGMGHIMRTLEIAKRMKSFSEVIYVCKKNKEKYVDGVNFIKKNGFKTIEIEENDMKNDIVKIKADCIITDSYDVDSKYYANLKSVFKISGCIDDEKICDYYDVDFIINQNIYADQFEYKTPFKTLKMLGSKYLILRDEFKKKDKKKITNNIKKIMITVGGSDFNNITSKIIGEIIDLDKELFVVIGPGFTNIEEITSMRNDKINLFKNPKMYKIMENVDLAVSSCGTTLYELLAMGVPTVGIKVSSDQEIAQEFFYKNKLIKKSNIINLKETIENFSYKERLEMSNRGQNIIDGDGIERIIKNIERVLIK